MIYLSLSDLTSIVEALIESENIPDYDYSWLLAIGFSLRDIMALKYLLHLIRANPSLKEREITAPAALKITSELKGLSFIKSAMGLSETDESLFQNNDAVVHDGSHLTYQMYMRFANSIEHNNPSIRLLLLQNICVDFADGSQLQSIPLSRDKSVAIPNNDKEAALVAVALLSDRYRLTSYDEQNCLMALECLIDKRPVTIEVRCLASTLKDSTYDAFCVENDLKPDDPSLKRKIVRFTEQIRS